MAGFLASGACATSTVPDSALEGVALLAVNPGLVVPESTLVIEGRSFVGEPFGRSQLHLEGIYRPDNVTEFDLDVRIPARFVDFDRMEATAGADLFTAIENLDGVFIGDATLEVVSAEDGRVYDTSPLPLELTVRRELTPTLAAVQSDAVIFVNDGVEVSGDGLLLGGSEGATVAVIEGCYLRQGAGQCADTGAIEVPVIPASPFDRTRGRFEFAPTIAGINPGNFEGRVLLRNRHAGGAEVQSDSLPAVYDLVPPGIFQVSTTSASLGQYVEMRGGGFVGRVPGASTRIRLVGQFTPTGAPASVPVDIELLPEFSSGSLVRYVLNEQDALGQALDLRSETGAFSGVVTPIVSFGNDEVIGTGMTMEMALAPIKQVVYLDFQISYVESLRHFGVRAVDALIRERVADNVRRNFAGVNLAVRLEPPADFALYTHVEIAGPDPDALGLLDHDNSPGKDAQNQRLDDRVAGIFIESLLGFSTAPGPLARPLPLADPLFDRYFDSFRPDRDGLQVVAADLASAIPKLSNADICPAGSRSEQIACAVWLLSALIAETVTHELGHALGLADPEGNGVHNLGDAPGRLMDAALDRPFIERAEIEGQGATRLCVEDYEYLRRILPSAEPADAAPRPSCR